MLNKKLLSAAVQAAVGPSTDPDFKQTVLLLHGDGTNGAQNNTFIGENYQPDQYAVSFDGTGDDLTTPANSALAMGTGDFTWECWAYFLNAPAFGTLIETRTSPFTNGFFVGFNSPATSFIVRTDVNVITTASAPALNTWHHIALVRSGTTLSLYIDGVREGTATNSTNLSHNILKITNNVSGIRSYISNFRVVKGTAVYDPTQTTLSVPTAPLTAITNTSLLTCQSATIVDNSSNNFTITANGNAAAIATSTLYPAITRNGNTTQGTFSPFSLPDGQWSNYFDGAGDSLTATGVDLSSGDWTIECWVYFQSFATTAPHIFSIGTNATNRFALFRDPGTSKFNFITVNSNVFVSANSTTTPAVGQWYHVAVVSSSGTRTLYVNGVSENTSTSAINNGTSYAIGNLQYSPGANDPLTGYVSNFRVVTSAVYTSNFTPTTAPLTAITNTQYLTCQSNRFVDTSSSARAITRNGDVRVTAFSPFAPTAAYDAGTNGASGYFDGTGDYLSVADDAAFDLPADFTLEGWFYPQSYSTAFSFALGSENSGSNGFNVFFSSSTMGLFSNNTNVISVTNTASLNTWHHFAVVRSGSTITFYINGVSAGTATNTTSFTGVAGNGFGICAAYTSSYFARGTGYISNFRLVKGTAVYTSAFTPPTAPLTAITNTSLLLNFTNAGIIDSTGKNVLETVADAQIDTTTKKYGTGAMEFDGSGDWLLMPNTPDQQLGTGNFTVEFWVYLATGDTGSARGLVAKGTSTTGWLVSLDSSEKVVFTYSSSTITSSGAINLDAWNHIAVVREGTGSNQTKIYINGTNDGTDTVSTDFNQTSVMYVGCNRTAGDPMKGFIDDVRVTKGIARYTTTFTPPTAPFEDQ